MSNNEFRMMNDEPVIKKKFDLEERLIDFSVLIVKTVESLPSTRTGNHLRSQLLRSGTSPALNYGEAQSAESKRDFIHKFGIILKELRELLVCLKILKKVLYLKDEAVLVEANELIAIFNKSIMTARRNAKG
jgi:four helix bundle protein